MSIARCIDGLLGTVYKITVVENGFSVEILKSLYEHILDMVRDSNVLKKITGITSTINGDSIFFEIKIPFFIKFEGNEIIWEDFRKNREGVGLLLYLINYLVIKEDGLQGFYLNNRPQLMIVEIESGLEVGFSKEAVVLIAENYVKDAIITQSEEQMFRFRFSLCCDNQSFLERREDFQQKQKLGISYQHIRAVVKQGIPSFVIGANCACFTTRSTNFFERTLYPHNIDSNSDKMAMLAGVVTFWNEVLIPLSKENK